jgi:prepilin-type N-terminal cleavage/methylation domain-containing protein/prepilin-type processing-associated H-X9-DG protein
MSTAAIRKPGFTLAELLVCMGILAMLVALLLPSFNLARQHALSTKCAASMQGQGRALVGFKSEYEYYPMWDDGGVPIRYTWIDVLIERGYMGSVQQGYCPSDPKPEPFNEARARQMERDLIYPLNPEHRGVDYSYGISVPLSAGAWNWSPSSQSDMNRSRRLADPDRFTSRRVLAADGNWSKFYNLSGVPHGKTNWNNPTQYDNMIEYRHTGDIANMLFQDGHVDRVRYHGDERYPVDTIAQFVWYPAEPVQMGPEHHRGDQWYPSEPAPHRFGDPPAKSYPTMSCRAITRKKDSGPQSGISENRD